MASALVANVAVFLAIAVLGVGALLTAVSALSWRRLGHRRLLFVSLAFASLALEGAWASLLLLSGSATVDPVPQGFAFLTILLLYASVAVR
jgi:hypothetical protein